MTGSVSAMTMTDVDRDALREGLRLGEVEVQRCERQSTEGAEPLRDSGFEGAVEEYARRALVLAAVAAVVRRELEAPGDDEALWREYEEAREEFENSAKLYQFAGDSESLSDLARDRARLDAAVRALAAAPPAESQREDMCDEDEHYCSARPAGEQPLPGEPCKCGERAWRGVGQHAEVDADAMFYHWLGGSEDIALVELRGASDAEAMRFLEMLEARHR